MTSVFFQASPAFLLVFSQIHNPVAIDLLYHEAYHHYIKNLYPCSDRDVLILAGILMQLNLGDFEQKKCQRFLAKCATSQFLHQLDVWA